MLVFTVHIHFIFANSCFMSVLHVGTQFIPINNFFFISNDFFPMFFVCLFVCLLLYLKTKFSHNLSDIFPFVFFFNGFCLNININFYFINSFFFLLFIFISRTFSPSSVMCLVLTLSLWPVINRIAAVCFALFCSFPHKSSFAVSINCFVGFYFAHIFNVFFFFCVSSIISI